MDRNDFFFIDWRSKYMLWIYALYFSNMHMQLLSSQWSSDSGATASCSWTCRASLSRCMCLWPKKFDFVHLLERGWDLISSEIFFWPSFSAGAHNPRWAPVFSHQQELSQHLHALHCTGIAFCIRAQHNTGLDPSITHRWHDSQERELMILLPEEMNQCW